MKTVPLAGMSVCVRMVKYFDIDTERGGVWGVEEFVDRMGAFTNWSGVT